MKAVVLFVVIVVLWTITTGKAAELVDVVFSGAKRAAATNP